MRAFTYPNRRPRLPHKTAALAGLVAAADVLFYGHALGVSVALFMLPFVAVTWYLNGIEFADRAGWTALLLAAAGWVAVIENVSWLSVGFALAGAASLALARRADWLRDGGRWMTRVLTFAGLGWTRSFRDAYAFLKTRRKRRRPVASRTRLVAWALPAGLSLVFVWLFAAANPVIADWLHALLSVDLSYLFAPGRWLFWLAAAILCWPFVRPRLRRRGKAPNAAVAQSVTSCALRMEALFSADAIVRSLLVFNALFAVQTGLDAAYLWGGQALPDGMTYAQYAHRGAYPLMAVAVLAAVFVLIAMRPGSESARIRLVRWLVYVWLAQTVVLVGASVWRLGLYVSVYSLSYLRVAALVWMGLVAMGLLWIVLRLIHNKTNAWLVRANMLTAMAALYICAFVDVGGAIAWFNVEHSRAVRPDSAPLDTGYLQIIGPPAVPALYWYLENGQLGPEQAADVQSVLAGLSSKLNARHANWRGYSFRSYRLSQHPAMVRSERLARMRPRWRIGD